MRKRGGGAMRMEEMAWSIKQGKKGLYREKISIRLPFEAVRKLEEKARAQGLSLSDLMRLYIERGLKEDQASGMELKSNGLNCSVR
jgi:hypothetical protein